MSRKMVFGRYDYAAFLTFASYAMCSIVIPMCLVPLARDLHFPLDEGGMGMGGAIQLGRSIPMTIMLILCGRLFMLTILEEEKWAEAASNQNTKEITTSAPRGEILDRYGRVLATNEQLFTVTFNASGLSTEDINQSAYKLVKLLEKNDDDAYQ